MYMYSLNHVACSHGYCQIFMFDSYKSKSVFTFSKIADVISIEQSIATTFKLRQYKDVIVRKVEPKVRTTCRF